MSEKRRDHKGRVLRNGEVQRKDGKYMFRYTDVTGKRRTIYSWKLVATDSVPNGKRCDAALRDMERQVQSDLNDDIRSAEADAITVNMLFASFMEIRIDLKENTRRNYIDLYEKHVRDPLGFRKIKNVRYTDIQRLYIYMIKEEGLKGSTVQSVHSLLGQMFQSAVMDSIIRVNPTEGVMKALRKMFDLEQEKRHALTEEQQERLVDYVYGSKLFERWSSLLTVLLGTGMRIGEALGLRWCDCDFEKNMIIVDHALIYRPTEHSGYEYRISEPKTKSGFRMIPMFSDVRDALLRQKERNGTQIGPAFTVDGYTDFIFLNNNGKVFTPAGVFDTIQNIKNSYNREEFFLAAREHREPCYLPKMSAHIFRHTFCTRLCENEPNLKNIQDVMGHKNLRTTMDVYNEATEKKKMESFQALEGKIKLA